MLTLQTIRDYRAVTYRTRPDLRIDTKAAAIDHVNARGFTTFWPIKGITMPSVWAAVAGDREVPNNHDDPAHKTWGWKDDLLDQKVWYYAKVLRRKATMISLEVAPYFYALSENFGAPEEDYLDQYRDGTMTAEAKQIYEALLYDGPLNALALRRAASMTDKSSTYRFNKGLEELQMDFKVLPVGVAEAGAWNYAFIYECVHRFYPDLPERARSIKTTEARRKLLTLYFESVGAVGFRDVSKVFWWRKRDMERALDALAAEGVLVRGLELPKSSDEWIALPDLAL